MKYLLLIFCLFLIGCVSIPKHEDSDSIDPVTPGKQLIKVINSTNWLATIAILGVGAGVFAFLNGSTKGIQIMAASFVVLSLVLGVARFGFWLATLPLLGSLAILIYAGYANRKALKEIISNVQMFKDFDANTDTYDYLKQRLSKQSKSTQQIVTEIKAKLNGDKNGEN